MLLRYIVSNFKSIGHPVEFSMLPIQDTMDERFLKSLSTKNGEWPILQRGGLFGPNASGKSSFIKSIAFARDFIIEGQKSGKGIRIDQFRGELEELKGISTFQFVFYLNGEIYEYGFSLDRHQVYEEWAMQHVEDHFLPLFTRATDSDGKTKIDIESRFARNGSRERNLSEILKDSIQENQRNQLFLYKLYDNGIKKAEKIVEWFRNLQIIFPKTRVKALPIRMKADTELRTYIGDMLRKMDTGVFEISVASKEIDFHDFAKELHVPQEILEEIEEIKNGIVNFAGKYFVFAENKKKRTMLVQLNFLHRLNGRVIPFDIDEESDGTQRLLDLLPMLFAMREDSHAIYFVDEIDRSLHTKLSQYLLREFVDRCENAYSQIIFTAHDVNLININEFRQEEIWFIEKNHLGESRLRPLSDFNLQKGQDVLKAYLSGRFGAVPMIRRDF
ncbi:MAG: ATP-binding protein [Eubacteriales bacterium]|nr:ATP-binding protein [Eubacteriales bacterium]